MKKHLLLTVFALLALAILVGCGGEDPPTTPPVGTDVPDVSLEGVSFSSLTVNYDGTEKSIAVSGTLPEGVTVAYEKNSATDAGVYEAKAKFYFTGIFDGKSYDSVYLEDKDMTATLTVNKIAYNMSGISFPDAAFDYDGSAKSIARSGTLPSGLSVTYENNGKANAGIHTVTARFTPDKNNLEPSPLTAKLTINRVAYDLSGISFADTTLTYDGDEHTVLITGTLPGGVTVSYEGGGKKLPGSYTVRAKFVGDSNHLPIADMTATLTILNTSYDMSAISFPDGTLTYDGKKKSIFISGILPDGVTVKYIGNGMTEPGEYTVTAVFTSSDPTRPEIPNMTATLTVARAEKDMSEVLSYFVDQTRKYTGTSQTVKIPVFLIPEGVSVSYEGSGILPGDYKITARFTVDEKYYKKIDPITITLTIADTPIVAENQTVDFDGMVHYFNIDTSTLPEGVTLTVVGNDGFYLPGVYKITLDYTVVGEVDNPELYDDITLTLTIKESSHTAGVVTEGSTIVGYTGNENAIIIPEGITAIASEAFKGNSSIIYILLPSSMKSIGNNAFKDCTSLSVLNIKSGLEVIGLGAFKNTKIKEISLPDSLKMIGLGAFEDTPVEKITLPFIGGSRVSSSFYLGHIFGATDYAGNAAFVPSTLSEVVISDSLEKIPAFAFFGCKNIKNIKIGNGVKEIGNTAFGGCVGLTSIYIPDSVKTIAANEYYHNSPFFACSEELLVVFGCESIVDYVYQGQNNSGGFGFGQFYLNLGENKVLTALYGATYAEYLAIISQNQ